MKKTYIEPRPVVNDKEKQYLDKLTKQYEYLIKPGRFAKAGKKVFDKIPKSVKNGINALKEEIKGAELYEAFIQKVAKGFEELEKHAAKITVSEKRVVKQVDRITKYNTITCLDEVCLARGYNISKLVASYRTKDILVAFVEGGATGFFGFAGILPNLVLSTFIYFRAVQSIATYYGYDVKKDPAELVIAGDVFMKALSPKSKGDNELTGMIGKIMVMTETTVVKQTAAKSWEAMASRGGVCLVLAQMRALSNKAAQKALEKAGQKGLEKSLFKSILEQMGKKLTKDAIGKAVPFVGMFVGGMFDTAQMSTILEYAEIFYHKRFILEKEVRVNLLINGYDVNNCKC